MSTSVYNFVNFKCKLDEMNGLSEFSSHLPDDPQELDGDQMWGPIVGPFLFSLRVSAELIESAVLEVKEDYWDSLRMEFT